MTDRWRDATRAVLRGMEHGLAGTRRGLDRVLGRAQLHVHAWREAFDPDSRTWLENAKESIANGAAATGAATREDLLARIEEERKTTRS